MTSARTRLLVVQDWPGLANQARYRATELAKICGVELKSLERFFRERLGTSPQRWLDRLRHFEAQKLLVAGKRTKEIAYLLHYTSASDLCHHFKSNRGICLTEWKRRFGGTIRLTPDDLSAIDNLS